MIKKLTALICFVLFSLLLLTSCNSDDICTNHIYDNDCDATCNTEGCGVTRQINHVFDNDCDATCNTVGCGETRQITHVFDNVCDTTCNIEGCGVTRQINHVFDNDCDATCNTEGCGETRQTNHVFDNDCDATCNTVGCGETRQINHVFDHDYDKTCNTSGCNHTREIKMQSVLLIGQSNMSGRGDLNTVVPISDDRIFMMRNGGWVKMQEPIHETTRGGAGIGASFAKAFVESFDCYLGLIPCAEGGTSLADWAVGGTLYNNAVAQAKIALETSDICAILWHQGESDQNNESYAAQFKVILDAMIAELGLDADKLVIITGELFGTRSDKVHRGQLELLANEYKNYGIASSDGLTVFDVTTHFDAQSLRVFGYRYFDIFYNYITGNHYEFDQDPESYYVEPPAPDPDAPIVSENFNSLYEGAISTIPGKATSLTKGGSITIEALSETEKYLLMKTGIDTDSKYGDTFIDFTNSVTPGSIIILEARFKLGENFTTAADLFKLLGTSTVRTVRVGTDGKLYTMDGTSLSDYLGYSLDKLEWTKIKVVLDLANNIKNIYILDKLVLISEISEADISQNEITKTRLVQFIKTTVGSSELLVDDYVCYYGTAADVKKNVTYIGSEYFNNLIEGTKYTAATIIGNLRFNSVSEQSYLRIVARNANDRCLEVTRGSDGQNTYVDLNYPIAANTKLVLEGSFKLVEGKVAADLLKLTPSSGSYNLLYLNTKGELCDWVYTNGSGAQGEVLGKLSKDEWTTVKIVCDLKNNTKEIYINGILVKSGLVIHDSSTADVKITKCRAIQLKGGTGSLLVDDISYYTE